MDIIKLLTSITIGYGIGYERHKRDKSGSGSRTLAIVSLTSCLLAILTLKIQALRPEVHNFSRLISYGLVAIGFLCSSVIVHNKDNIDGTTSAISIFAILIINYFIGLGYFLHGIGCAFLLYLILDSKYWWKNET